MSNFPPLGQVSITNPPLYSGCHRNWIVCIIVSQSVHTFYTTCSTEARFSLTLLLKLRKWVQTNDLAPGTFFFSLEVKGRRGLLLPALQQPGTRLKRSSEGVILTCRASFTNSSCPLPWSSTSQWIGWWFSHRASPMHALLQPTSPSLSAVAKHASEKPKSLLSEA